MTEGSSPIRLALIGTGAISQIVHVPILAERRDVDLVVLSDADIHKAETVAGRFAVPEVASPEEAATRDGIDGVVICSTNRAHETTAIAALEAGKHVFVERPIATSSAGAERVLAAARSAGRSIVVGLPHRFRPEVAALRDLVAGGEFGSLYAMRGSWLTRRVPLMRPTWRQDPVESGGGALVDLGVPALDLCLWILGYPEVKRLSCVVHRSEFEVEDAATLMGETEDGVVLSVEVSNTFFADEDRYYARVMGTDGSASLPPLEVFKQLGGRPLEVTPRQPKPRGGENPYTNAYRRLIDQFVRVVSGRSDVELPVEQVALMRLIEASYESAATGREVSP